MVNIPFDIDQYQWGSRLSYPDGTLEPWRPDGWVVHYMGGPVDAGRQGRAYQPQVALEKSTLQAVQKDHMDNPRKRWKDIAYNYAIGQSGLIYRLRGENRAGATRGDWDRDGIPANYEKRAVLFILGGDQEPSVEALEAFHVLWSAQPMVVIGHRDVYLEGSGGTPTECPGDSLYGWLKDGGYAVDKEEVVSLPLRDYEREAIDRLVEAGVFTSFTTDEPGEVDEFVPLRTLAVFLDRLLSAVDGTDEVARVGVSALADSLEALKDTLRSV